MANIGNLFYLIYSIINIIIPLQGFFALHKTKKDYLLRGGFIFFNALNLASWLIYGFLSKQLKYSNPIYLGIAVIYIFVSLIWFKEYANIVYHNVILINYCWWIRQQKVELIYQMNILTTGMFFILPHFMSLYYSLRKEKKEYMNPSQIILHAISAVFYLAFCINEGFVILAVLSCLKLAILGLQVFIYRKLQSKENFDDYMKKKN